MSLLFSFSAQPWSTITAHSKHPVHRFFRMSLTDSQGCHNPPNPRFDSIFKSQSQNFILLFIGQVCAHIQGIWLRFFIALYRNRHKVKNRVNTAEVNRNTTIMCIQVCEKQQHNNVYVQVRLFLCIVNKPVVQRTLEYIFHFV